MTKSTDSQPSAQPQPAPIYRGERLVGFTDLIYALSIGTAFTSFPDNPLLQWQTSLMFLTTIWLGLQEWYEFHLDQDRIESGDLNNPGICIHVLCILSALTIHLLFRYAALMQLVHWFLALSFLYVLGGIYNSILSFRNNLLFAIGALVLALVYSLSGLFVVTPLGQILPTYQPISLLVIVWIIEALWVYLVGRFERSEKSETD